MRSSIMRVGQLALALALIVAGPVAASAQEQSNEEEHDLSLGFSSGYINMGQFVTEEVRHVRFGNTGKDLYFAFDVETKPRDLPVGFTGRLLVSPTTYFTWPADGPDDQLSRWHWRPDAERAWATSVVWSCLTVGAQLHPASWLSAGTGGGFCSLSGGNYLFGALPMHTPVMQVNVRATKAISDRMRVGAECSSHPTYLSKERFSVLHEQAGEDPRVGRWISPVQCGITIRANP